MLKLTTWGQHSPKRMGMTALQVRMNDWLKVAMQKDVVRRGLKVGLVVGTVLAAINQGNRILAGEWSMEVLLKIAMTYVVPYCVSTYASVSAILAKQPAGE